MTITSNQFKLIYFLSKKKFKYQFLFTYEHNPDILFYFKENKVLIFFNIIDYVEIFLIAGNCTGYSCNKDRAPYINLSLLDFCNKVIEHSK